MKAAKNAPGPEAAPAGVGPGGQADDPARGAEDPELAQFTERERALLDYAAKLTLAPGEMEPADLEPLREAGLDDRAVLDLAMIVGYYAYVNRLASGLGVEVEPGGPPHAIRD